MSSRFPVKHEFNRHWKGFTGFAQEAGTWVKWYRYNTADSRKDDVYDEEDVDELLVFHKPRYVYAMNIDTPEGEENKSVGGFYTTDLLRGIFSTEHLRRAGIPDLTPDIFIDRSILKDRLVYEGRVWSPRTLEFQGNVQDTNLTFTLTCVEIDVDEYVMQQPYQQP